MIVPDSGGRKILDYFVEGLENNFTRDAITSYLVRRKGIKMRDIKKSLELVPKSDTKLVKALKMLPKSFSNVKGGMKKGIKLFNQSNAVQAKFNKQKQRRKGKKKTKSSRNKSKNG